MRGLKIRMKIANFILEKIEGDSPTNWKYYATVDVTTGILWWKKTKNCKIFREYGGFWHFVETGKFTPGTAVDALSRAWQAKTGQYC